MSEVSGIELLKHLEFLEWEEYLCYANEGTQGGTLQSCTNGDGHWEEEPCDEKFGNFRHRISQRDAED